MAGDTKESEIVKSLRNVPGRTLLLFGNKGSGKLALCNKLAGRQVFNESDFIERSHEITFLSIGQKGSEDEKISLINTPDKIFYRTQVDLDRSMCLEVSE